MANKSLSNYTIQPKPKFSFFCDLEGQVFERLTVGPFLGCDGKHSFWLCTCSCGETVRVSSQGLKSRHTKSCGCLNREMTGNRARTHGQSHKSPAWQSWTSMLTRCLNANAKSYEVYGKLGITVCDRWKTSFENFYADMGDRPQGTTLDRINSSGNYEPQNCRWATPTAQNNNRKDNLLFTIDGKTMTLAEWCKWADVPYMRTYKRLRRGWTIEDALDFYVLDEMKHPSIRPLAPPAEVTKFAAKGGGR